MTITFDPTAFRATYKQFALATCFPDVMLNAYFDTAQNFISAAPNCVLTANQQALVINLMVAHLAAIGDSLTNGKPLAILTDAQIDKVRVTVKPPPIQETSEFQWWLNLTPYGQQILVLFNTASVGGFYVGGIPERNGFRRAYGGFGGVVPWLNGG